MVLGREEKHLIECVFVFMRTDLLHCCISCMHYGKRNLVDIKVLGVRFSGF